MVHLIVSAPRLRTRILSERLSAPVLMGTTR